MPDCFPADCAAAANSLTSRRAFRCRCRSNTGSASNRSMDRRPRTYDASAANPIVSDTKELNWYTSDAKTGLVTVETDRAQALIGFMKANHKTLKNLGADIANNFATIVLTSMDDKPLAARTRCSSTRVRAWPTQTRNGTTLTPDSDAAGRAIPPRSSSR